MGVMLAPPYSAGQCGATQPRSCTACSHSDGGGLRLGRAEDVVVLPAALVAELAARVGDRLVVRGQPLLD